MSLIIIAALVAVILVYALWVREWLLSKTWAAPFFDLVEPVEIVLFRKSPTILFARLKVFSGLLLSLLTQLGTIDITPLMPLVPEKYRSVAQVAFNLLPMTISIIGLMDENLRKKTTLPIELVEVKEATAPPEVKAAIVQAEAAKVEAVAVVQAAKAT